MARLKSFQRVHQSGCSLNSDIGVAIVIKPDTVDYCAPLLALTDPGSANLREHRNRASVAKKPTMKFGVYPQAGIGDKQ